MRYILALDQGTTSSRALLIDQDGAIGGVAQQEYKQHYPKPGWVEHDPQEIWSTQLAVAQAVLQDNDVAAEDIGAIGIVNQRETTVVWDRETGEPVHHALVWQDRRTSGACDALREAGHLETFQQKTGLILDAYFSGTKVAWILEHVEGARARAEAGELAFGTIDSWLIWNLTNGEKHVTDASNASRTLFFNIHDGDWDDELLDILKVPRSMLPEVVDSSGVCGETAPDLFGVALPIAGMAGDQQAALFGQQCTRPGMVKNSYGTGCFMLLHTGEQAIPSTNNLLTTVAWRIDGKLEYALEGSIFIAGAVVQWLRDELGMIQDAAEVEALAETVEDNGGAYLVPAFAGLGAPHWDQYARGVLVGLTRGTNKAHIARAALEGIAYQVMDLMAAMEADADTDIEELRVDGGAAANDLLLQFQSDMANVPIARPSILESTALGAAFLAGLAVGFWPDKEALASQWNAEARFKPTMKAEDRTRFQRGWEKALKRARAWETDDE